MLHKAICLPLSRPYKHNYNFFSAHNCPSYTKVNDNYPVHKSSCSHKCYLAKA